MSDTPGATDRKGLVERLFFAFGEQLSDNEARSAKARLDGVSEDPRHLGALAKTLDTLLSLEKRFVTEEDGVTLDLEALRTELAERLSKLRGGDLAPQEG
ncbi:MAG: hypothetical protein AAF318_11230 [Pseudomonadota bacterium]